MTDHSDREHSELPPSSADKWMACPGWRAKTHDFRVSGDDITSAAAEEGTRAHEAFEAHLRAVVEASRLKNPEGPSVPIHAQSIPEEMAQHLLECADWVLEQPGDVWLETRVDFGAPYGWVGLTGTADVIVWHEEEKQLTIADLKYGRHYVDHRENPQLKIYAVGAMDHLGLEFSDLKSIRTTILQPRATGGGVGPARSHVYEASEFEVFHNQLNVAIGDTFKANAPLVAGDHCRKFCPALGSCEAAAKFARQVYDKTLDPKTPEDMEQILNDVPFMDAWIAAIKMQARAMIGAGIELRNCTLGTAQRRRSWVDEEQALAWLRKSFPLKVVAPRKVLSVAQAEKVVKGMVPEDLVETKVSEAPLHITPFKN